MDPAGVFATTFPKDQALVRTRPQAVCLALFIALLFALPFLADIRAVAVMTSMLITGIVVIGLQINTGIAGQVNLGQAAFMGVGAYTTALLASKLSLPFWLALPLGGAAAALFGLIFGLTADQVAEQRASGYNPRAIIESSRELHQAVDAIASGVFSPDDPHRYAGLMGGLYDSDWFMLAADFDSYAAAQRKVDGRWLDPVGWRTSAIKNIANVGWFSSDRTISEYARDIWKVL